jgi:site-specific recombinase XerD
MQPPQLASGFANILEQYKDGYMAARNLAPRSRVEYKTAVGQFLFYLQSINVTDIKQVEPKHINSFLASLDRQGLAGVTRRKKLIILRTFFSWLRAEGITKTNPAKSAIPPLREDTEPRVLSKGEYQHLLAVVQKPRDRAIIQILLQTGIRLSEIQQLKLSDINIPTRITKDSLGTTQILGKGRKTRTVLLNAKACEALYTWLKERPNLATDAVFLSSRSKPLSSRQFQYLVGKYMMKAGIKAASVHTLRHTFATHHIAMGTDLITVQEFLGHASLDTTKLYIGLAEKRKTQHIQDHAL